MKKSLKTIDLIGLVSTTEPCWPSKFYKTHFPNIKKNRDLDMGIFQKE